MEEKWDVGFVWSCNWILMVTLWSLNVADGKWGVGGRPPHSLVFGSFPPLPLFGFCAHSIQACPDLNWFAWAIVTQLPGKNDSAFHQIRKATWGLCWIVDSSLWKICSEDQQHIAVWKIRNICSTLPVVSEVENCVFRVNLHHLCQLVLWQEEVVLGFFFFF